MIKAINHVWIDKGMVFQARPIDDVVNDGADMPDNRKIKWVVFRVFTRPMNELEFDACGYAESLSDAKRGLFAK
jgi:hypothetical protein